MFLSNHALYGDMGARICAIDEGFAPGVEVYSIGQSFDDLLGMGTIDLAAHAQDLRATVRQGTGIPTCVGIGPTKTLAKIKNRVARRDHAPGGIFGFSDPRVRAAKLERIVLERRATSCLVLEQMTPQRDGCAVPRSFATRISDLPTMLEATAAWATRLAEKLRHHGFVTDGAATVFHMSAHDKGPRHNA